jgi:hypothetical protein
MSQSPVIPSLACPNPQLHPGTQGIARVAVDDANAQLLVTFLAPIVLPQQSFLLNPASYSLFGGQRIFPRVVAVELPGAASPPIADSATLVLTLNNLGDFSIYTLTVSGPNIDPFFASRQLRFRLACDERFDCRSPAAPVPVQPELQVNIDYLAKDYSSFRQALLDFIPTRLPEWTERSEADLGIMLLELFAATADNLSYMQDRVANEAFLNSATQRRSVAGHLALIGYQMDQGASASTFLQLQVNTVHTLPGGQSNPGLKISNLPGSSTDPVIVFETLGGATLRPQHNQMSIYTWENQSCCLPAAALSVALLGSYDQLQVGDYLLIQDNAGHSDVVQLTSQPKIVSPLDDTSSGVSSPPLSSPPSTLITILSWSQSTPLHYDYCLCDTATSPPTACTWARGNVVPATHGETVTEDIRNLTPSQIDELQFELAALPTGSKRPRQRLQLSNAPLAHLDPSTFALSASAGTTTVSADPDAVTEILTRAPSSISTLHILVEGVNGVWLEANTLLNSSATDLVFRVEIDDSGQATVVFGDDTFGRSPSETAKVTATYRVGGGSIGNIAAGALTQAVTPEPWLDSVINVSTAQGGRDQETSQHARMVGPAGSHDPLVAVTVGDYQTATQAFQDPSGNKPVQRANASFQWTGSWLTTTVAVEPQPNTTLTTDLTDEIVTYLNGRRLAGYDLEVLPALYVPLDIIVQFCTAAGFRPADVQQSLLQALSNTTLPGGSLGFFHPSLFSFGDPVYVSRLYAAIMAVPGVDSAQITRLAELHSPTPDADTSTNLARGFLSVTADQIIRLDNDRNFPQNGSLSIVPKGAEQ